METMRKLRMLGALAPFCWVLLSPLAIARAAEVEPVVLAAGEGDVGYLPGGFEAVHKVGAVSTGASKIFLATGLIPPGMDTGKHLHEVDEEVLYVLEGELTLTLDDEVHTLAPGATAFVPPGTWMQLSNHSDAPAKAIVMISRGEVERCFRLVHGIEGYEPTDAERAADLATCKMKLSDAP